MQLGGLMRRDGVEHLTSALQSLLWCHLSHLHLQDPVQAKLHEPAHTSHTHLVRADVTKIGTSLPKPNRQNSSQLFIGDIFTISREHILSKAHPVQKELHYNPETTSETITALIGVSWGAE